MQPEPNAGIAFCCASPSATHAQAKGSTGAGCDDGGIGACFVRAGRGPTAVRRSGQPATAPLRAPAFSSRSRRVGA
jgi:hypothetical protein